MLHAVVVFCDQTPERAMRQGPELKRLDGYVTGVAGLLEGEDPDVVFFCGGPKPDKEYLAKHTPAGGTASAVVGQMQEDPDCPIHVVDGPSSKRSAQFDALIQTIDRTEGLNLITDVTIVCERRLRVVPGIYLGSSRFDAKVKVIPIGDFRAGVTNFAKGSAQTVAGY